MRILITGAESSLARVLARRLCREHPVLSLGVEVPGAVPVEGGLRDSRPLRRALEGVQVVLHVAVTPAGVLLPSAHREGVRRVVWIGEDLPSEPGPVPLVQLVPALTLGPPPPSGPHALVRALLEGRIDATPTGRLSFVDVRDVGAAVEAAMSRDVVGERLGLAAATWSLADFFATLAELADRPAPVVDGRPWTPGVHAPVLDPAVLPLQVASSRATEALGWWTRSPVRTLADSLG